MADKTSIVIHSEYFEDMPEGIRKEWEIRICEYSLFGIEPVLTDWRDVKIWKAILSRIEYDKEKFYSQFDNNQKWNNVRHWEAEYKKAATDEEKALAVDNLVAVLHSLNESSKRNELLAIYEPLKANLGQMATISGVNSVVCSINSVVVHGPEDGPVENSDSSTSSLLPTDDKDKPEEKTVSVEEWKKKKDIKDTKKDSKHIEDIDKYLKEHDLDTSYLDYLYEILQGNHYKANNINLGLMANMLDWDDKLDEYRKSIQDKTIKDKDASKGTGHLCPKCGGFLFATSPNEWACYICRKTYQLKAGGQSGELEECTA